MVRHHFVHGGLRRASMDCSATEAPSPIGRSTAHAAHRQSGHPREAADCVPCAETVDTSIFIEDFTTCRRLRANDPNLTEGARITGAPESGYLGVILAILLPCIPRPAISPFWPKTKA